MVWVSREKDYTNHLIIWNKNLKFFSYYQSKFPECRKQPFNIFNIYLKNGNFQPFGPKSEEINADVAKR